MKQWIALLLTLSLLFSLTACSGNDGGAEPSDSTPSTDTGEYDASYTLFVNGEEEWTPFPGKSGVSFSSSKEGVLSLRPTDASVAFTGKQVGTTVITATCDDKTATAFVEVKEMDVVIDYRYTPPTDNFCIEIKSTENGSSYTNTYAKIGTEEAMTDESTEWQQFCNISTGAYYTVVDGKWYGDVQWGFYAFEESGGHGSPICDFYDFTELLGQMGFGNEKLPEFFVGQETLLDVDCWVFDSNGWNGIYAKFWVDPTNGCTLKKAGTTTDTVLEITRYDLSYTEWDSSFLPD